MKYVISYTLVIFLNLFCVIYSEAQVLTGKASNQKSTQWKKLKRPSLKAMKEKLNKESADKANSLSKANRALLKPEDMKDPPKIDPRRKPSDEAVNEPDEEEEKDGAPEPKAVAGRPKKDGPVIKTGKRDEVAPSQEVKVQSGGAEEEISFPGTNE